MKEEEKEIESPTIWNVISSVLAAMIGIQSDENRERDFKHGSLTSYIFVGVVVVAIFVFSLIAIVNSILEDAAK